MRKNTALPMTNTICTLVFLVFVFTNLFCFQNNMLVYAQHVLSGGTTVYNSLVGAVILSIILGLLSLFSSRFFTNNMYSVPAIYHLPSLLVLASLTDVHITSGNDESVYGHTWIVSIVIFCVLILINRLAKGMLASPQPKSSFDIIRNVNLNIVVMLAMIAYVMAMSNTNEMDHEVLRQEVLIRQERFAEVLSPAKKQNLASAHLTTLRSFAMVKTKEVGEHFFEYPVLGNSDDILPSTDNPMLVAPDKQIFKFIGGKPAEGMKAKFCLQVLDWRGKLNPEARDYLYLAFLLDKDLDGFVNHLAKDSADVANLPKHYREALVLYNHLRTEPKIDFSKPELETDFSDFEALRKKNADKVLNDNALRQAYGTTYWYYYYRR